MSDNSQLELIREAANRPPYKQMVYVNAGQLLAEIEREYHLERTCTVVEKVNECSGLVNRCCSECGYVFGVKGFGRWEQPNYCTKCGAEVMR